jgi:pimeloyl-ACP methyl ester carboxylesterase
VGAAAGGGGPPTPPPYTLQALAADAVALLDHLGQAGAHVIGLSMGGMVAQWMAITHPARLFSATLLMTSSGAPGLPPPAPEVAAAMLARPSGEDRAALLEHALRTCDLVGGPHYRSRDVGLGRFAAAALDRAYHPAGFVRQLAAIVADTDRAGRLAGIRVPTLVVHGDADPLLPLACGQDVAARIPGARLVVVPHMGHDLPEPLLPELLAHIRTHLAAVPLRR